MSANKDKTAVGTDIQRGKVIATVGMFDGVHQGHRHMLHAVVGAKDTGLKKIWQSAPGPGRGHSIAFTFDRHPLALVDPGREPKLLCNLDERVRLIRECGIERVEVLHFDESLRSKTAAEFIGMLARDYWVGEIVMGYDHGFGSDRLSDIDDYRRAAAQSHVAVRRCGSYIYEGEPISSSRIRTALAQGSVESAAAMLGRSYTLRGRVIPGKRLGRSMGFPTANLAADSTMTIPASGVYAARVTVEGHSHVAMVNVGHNPTVSDGAALSIEAHIIDFGGDIYGKEIAVHFVRRMRDERRFSSIDKLRSQLEEDRRAVIGLHLQI